MNNIIFRTHREDARGNVFTVLYPYRVNFCGIAADLARLDHNWNELFEGAGNTEPSESEGLTDND